MSDQLETETIDRLFLELSQVTKARTAREIAAIRLLVECEPYITAIKTGHNWNGPPDGHSALQRRIMDFLAESAS